MFESINMRRFLYAIMFLVGHCFSPVVSMSGDLLSVDISLKGEELYFVDKTPVTKADIFCKDGMVFMSEGLREEALDNFKLATEFYDEALHNEYMQKEDLIAIRENLKRMSRQLNGSTGEPGETKDRLRTSPIDPASFPTSKDSGTKTTVQVAKEIQHKPTPTPKLTPTPTPYVIKQDLKKAKNGEYWIIESTTILLKNPELYGNGTKLLGNLIGGISSGTTVEILETKGQGTVNRWVKVQVYNKKDEIYTKGWILSDTVGKARQIERR